jgi:hypothetical protein
MSYNRLIAVTIFALLVRGAFDPLHAQARPSEPNISPDELREPVSTVLAIAREALSTQYQVFVSGDIEGSLKGKPLLSSYRDAMRSTFDKQVQRHEALMSHGIRYTDFKTSLELTQTVNETGNKVDIIGKEFTELTLHVPGGPPNTVLTDEHHFEFVRGRHGWVLVSDTILRPKAPPYDPKNEPPGPLPPLPPPLTDAPKARKPGVMLDTTPGSGRRDTSPVSVLRCWRSRHSAAIPTSHPCSARRQSHDESDRECGGDTDDSGMIAGLGSSGRPRSRQLGTG